jgi:capsular exopolysaccharide synthesis family protein
MTEAERPEMTLRDYWRVLVRRKWIVLAGMVAAVAPAVTLSILQDPQYRADAEIIIRTGSGESVFNTGTQTNRDPDRIIANEISVLEGDVVREKVKETLQLQQDPPEVSGVARADTDVVTVSVESGDPQTAARLVNAYIDAYSDVKTDTAVKDFEKASGELQDSIGDLQAQIDDLDAAIETADDAQAATLETQRRALIDRQDSLRETLDKLRIDAGISTQAAEVVRPAEPPTTPFAPTPIRTAVLALVVGLLFGLGAAFLVDYLDQSIKHPGDLEKLRTEHPLLAVVPIVQTDSPLPISISNPADLSVESYRSLRTSVQFIGIERDAQVVQVTSAMPGEGKTTTSTNLAVVLAQTGATVVLVDADLRRPRVHQVFNIDASIGLTGNLVGEPIDLTLQTVEGGLDVIVAGSVPPNPSEMLSSRRMADLISELKQRYDYVIVDSAPTLPVSDAMALSRQVDGVLMVVQAGRVGLPQVRQALATLEQVNAPILGLVLNRVSEAGATDAYGYGYGYGSGYGAAPAPTSSVANDAE